MSYNNHQQCIWKVHQRPIKPQNNMSKVHMDPELGLTKFFLHTVAGICKNQINTQFRALKKVKRGRKQCQMIFPGFLCGCFTVTKKCKGVLQWPLFLPDTPESSEPEAKDGIYWVKKIFFSPKINISKCLTTTINSAFERFIKDLSNPKITFLKYTWIQS